MTWPKDKTMKEKQSPLTKKEKLNRNILLASTITGALIGITLAVIGLGNAKNTAQRSFAEDFMLHFVNSPVPAYLALGLVAFWLVIMPIITVYWWRKAVDEQEASANRDGAFYAGNAYVFLAPVWWMLWRGGMAPEPNGIVIFCSFNFVWLIIWFWKKYQ